MRTMNVQRGDIMLSTDIVVSAVAFLFGLLLLIGMAMVLRID